MLSVSYSSTSSFAAAAIAALSNSISSSPSLCSSLAYQNSGEQSHSLATLTNLPAFASHFDTHAPAYSTGYSASSSSAFGYSPSITRLMPKQQLRYPTRGNVTEDSFMNNSSNGNSGAFFLSPAASALSSSSSAASLMSPLHSYRQSSLGANRSPLNESLIAANNIMPLSISDLSRQLSTTSSIASLPLPLSRTSSLASTVTSSSTTSSGSSSSLPSVASFTELNDLLQRNDDEESSTNDLLEALRLKVKVEADGEVDLNHIGVDALEDELIASQDGRSSPCSNSVHSGVDGVDEEETEDFLVGTPALAVRQSTGSDDGEEWNENLMRMNGLETSHENESSVFSMPLSLMNAQMTETTSRKRKSMNEVNQQDETAEDVSEKVIIKLEGSASDDAVVPLSLSLNQSETEKIGAVSSNDDEMEMSGEEEKEEAFASEAENDNENEDGSPILSPSSVSSSDSAASTPLPFTPLIPRIPRRHDRELATRRERRRAADAQKRLNSLLNVSNEYSEIDDVWGMNRAVNQSIEGVRPSTSCISLDVSSVGQAVGKGYLMMAVESTHTITGHSSACLIYCKYVMFEDSVSVSSNNGRRNRRSDTHGLTTQLHLDKKTTVALAPYECVRQMAATHKKKRCRKSSSALAASVHANSLKSSVRSPSSSCSSSSSIAAVPSFRILISCVDQSNSISWRDEGEGRKQDYYHCLQFRRKQKYQIAILDDGYETTSKLLWLDMLHTKGHLVSFLSHHTSAIAQGKTQAFEEETACQLKVKAEESVELMHPKRQISSNSSSATSVSRRSARIHRQSSSSSNLVSLNTTDSIGAPFYLPSPVSYSVSAPLVPTSSLAPSVLWRGSSLICDDNFAASCAYQTQAP